MLLLLLPLLLLNQVKPHVLKRKCQNYQANKQEKAQKRLLLKSLLDTIQGADKTTSLELINSTLLDDETLISSPDFSIDEVETEKLLTDTSIVTDTPLTEDEQVIMEAASAEKAPSIFEEQWNLVSQATFEGEISAEGVLEVRTTIAVFYARPIIITSTPR